MLQTLADIQTDVALRLNEAANTPAGALQTGTGGAPVVATAATVAQLANEAVADLCRRGGLAIDGVGTLASVGAAVRTVALSTLVVAGGGTLWCALNSGVTVGGSPVQRISRGMAQIYGSAAPATYYFMAGQEALGLVPVPAAATGILSVPGLVIPTPLNAPGDPITPFLEVDLRKLISFYCCHYIAKKNLEDPTMEIRATPWGNDYEDGRLALLRRLLSEDPTIYSAHYSGLLPAGGK